MKKLLLIITVISISFVGCKKKTYTCKDKNGNVIGTTTSKSTKKDLEKNGATCTCDQ